MLTSLRVSATLSYKIAVIRVPIIEYDNTHLNRPKLQVLQSLPTSFLPNCLLLFNELC